MAEHPLACEVWQPALAGWLVAQLPPDEEAALSAHLAVCSACRAEADGLLHVAALTLGADVGHAAADPPPADLGDRIVARVSRERRARRVARVGIAMSAAAAAVAIAIVMTRDPGEPALRGEPISFVRQAKGVQATAVLAADEGGGSVIDLDARGLDPDTTYSLWLTPSGGGYDDRIPAGTFRPDADGEVDARLSCSLPPEDMGRAWATTPEGDIALDTEP
ncbi:MAG: anti-sigma factor family protein [Acidimicrobiales bacterium]